MSPSAVTADGVYQPTTKKRPFLLSSGAAALLYLTCFPHTALAQDTPLIVEGEVQQVFQSRGTSRVYLVQIFVERSEATRLEPGRNGSRFPAPGDSIYVHVDPQGSLSGRSLRNAPEGMLPDEQMYVRAYLTPRKRGTWQGALPKWFEKASQGDAASAGWSPSLEATFAEWGMRCETQTVKGGTAWRVTNIDTAGRARRAGLEVGDVIVGVNGKDVSQWPSTTFRRDAQPVIFDVVGVNTGRLVQVPLSGVSVIDDRPSPLDARLKRSLGVSTERVSLGLRSALKVTEVQPNSPAAKVALEPGDVLLAANGRRLTRPEELAAAVRDSGDRLTFTVRDVRSGREAPLQIDLSMSGAARDTRETPRGGGQASQLGVAAELAFYKTEAAVKITQVANGSPAQRAGLQSGDLILQVNGNAVLHPDELTKAISAAVDSVTLKIADPCTESERTIRIHIT